MLEVAGVGLFGFVLCAREGHLCGGAVEAGELRVVDVGIESAAEAIPPPVLGAMRGDAEVEATGASGGGEFANDIAMRAHLRGVPCGELRVVHGEAVSVFSDGDDVASSGAGEEIEPLVSVEVLSLEHGDEVLVAEGGLRAVGGDVVLEGGVAGNIHVAGIPLVCVCRDRVDAPVEEDSELCVLKPDGGAIGGKRVPVGMERAMSVLATNFCELMMNFGGGILSGGKY